VAIRDLLARAREALTSDRQRKEDRRVLIGAFGRKVEYRPADLAGLFAVPDGHVWADAAKAALARLVTREIGS
jgi:hypothetical protein